MSKTSRPSEQTECDGPGAPRPPVIPSLGASPHRPPSTCRPGSPRTEPTIIAPPEEHELGVEPTVPIIRPETSDSESPRTPRTPPSQLPTFPSERIGPISQVPTARDKDGRRRDRRPSSHSPPHGREPQTPGSTPKSCNTERNEESAEQRDHISHDLEDRLTTTPVPSLPTLVPVPVSTFELPSHAETETTIGFIRQVAEDAVTRYAADILETVRVEREEAAAQRARIAAELEERIRILERELAECREQLEGERQLRITEEAETREREGKAALDRDEAIRNQCLDITNLVQDQRDIDIRKRELMDTRWEDKQGRRAEKDARMAELRDTVDRILQDREADRLQAEADRAAAQERPGTDRILEELQRQDAELRELLNSLSETWREDCANQHLETLHAVRATAQEQVPFDVQGYLDVFCQALSSEVKVLLGEVGKLREERRALQFELGYMLCMKSKLGPGGEFDPDWRPPPGGPGGPPGDAPPPGPPVQPEEPPPAKPAPTWVTWQAPRSPTQPAHVPSPPSASIEPTFLVPDRASPELFGPRSPDSNWA